jgi:type 1 glutamine amidotransferase
MRTPFTAGSLIVLVSLAPVVRAADQVDPYDQSKVPLEVQPTDPALAKIVLIAGRQSHGPGDHEFFAGTAILMSMLKQTPGVFPVMARDGWPKEPKTFENARAIVFYMDGGAGHPVIQQKRMEYLQKLIDAKVGYVNLHYAVEYPTKQGQTILNWLGGFYETGYSINPHWVAHFKDLPQHPITRGVEPFSIRDEWYFNIRFPENARNLTPILKATPPDELRRTPEARKHPGRSEVVAWGYERDDGGRSFGFTGGHTHKNWADPNFRRLVVNAILWSAGVEVPSTGARVDMDPADIKRNLDRKGKR